MDIKTKAVTATIENTGPDTEFPGTFEVELTNPTLDRDGDELKGDEWQLPLPDRVTFVNDHTHKMASVVGSAKPSLEGDKIICRGDWGETDDAQNTRKNIKHAPYVSVAYREKRAGGKVSRELINGSFVVVPSNPTARVLSSKAFGDTVEDGLTDEVKDFIKSIVQETLSIKSQDLPAPDAPPAKAAAESADLDKEKALALADATVFEFSANHLL